MILLWVNLGYGDIDKGAPSGYLYIFQMKKMPKISKKVFTKSKEFAH
jgi:hypothetical protein